MTPSDDELAALAVRLGRALEARNLRVATAESCTGGWIAKALTDIPGSSRWVEGGVVAYSNSAKSSLLGVPAGIVAAHGAVSEPVVRSMAEGARARFGVPLTVAVSGVAGPDGGTPEKPIGTVWFAWANGRETTAARELFAGDREAVRRRSVDFALRRLLELTDAAMSGGPDAEADAAERTVDDRLRDSRRVFFALWPDADTRARLARATKDAVSRSGGRPIAKDRFHVTVAFLGNLTPAGLEIASAVPPISVGAFALVLDTVGVFAASRTLWLGARSVPPALSELESRLWEALTPKGFIREERIYLPHVTLARRARPVEAQIDPVEWPVDELALVESLPMGRNVHYEPLRSWPL